jgi:hypothetical protein
MKSASSENESFSDSMIFSSHTACRLVGSLADPRTIRMRREDENQEAAAGEATVEDQGEAVRGLDLADVEERREPEPVQLRSERLHPRLVRRAVGEENVIEAGSHAKHFSSTFAGNRCRGWPGAWPFLQAAWRCPQDAWTSQQGGWARPQRGWRPAQDAWTFSQDVWSISQDAWT